MYDYTQDNFGIVKPEPVRPSRKKRWLRTVLSYDGLLPIIVLCVPMVLATLVGQQPIVEFVAVALPIGAFIWRMLWGIHYINSNNCYPFVRVLQLGTLFLGLLFLLLVDTLVILDWTMPNQGLSLEDYLVTAFFYSIYFVLMCITLYPGKAKPNEVEGRS